MDGDKGGGPRSSTCRMVLVKGGSLVTILTCRAEVKAVLL